MEKPKINTYCDYVNSLNKMEANVHKEYHNNHYGFPIHDDNELFCRLVLEINQAGLSWTTILKKQENFRVAFHNFVKSSPFNGTVYAVCGTSGQSPGSTSAGWPMACMYLNNNSNNTSLVMDVSGSSFVCKYLSSTGTIVDQFTISKTIPADRIAETRVERGREYCLAYRRE